MARMTSTNWLDRTISRTHRVTRDRVTGRRPRLRFDSLEAREMPAAFTPGNLIVLQAGDSGQYATQGPLYLNEITAAGTAVQQAAINNTNSVGGTGNQPITLDLTAAAGNGQLNRTFDGTGLVFGGVDSALNNGGLTPPQTPTGTSNRVIAVVGSDPAAAGFVNTTTYGPFYIGDDNRGGVAEGLTGPVWSFGHPNQAGGAVSQGVLYFPGPNGDGSLQSPGTAGIVAQSGVQVSSQTNIRGGFIGFDNRVYWTTAGSTSLGLSGIYTSTVKALPTGNSPGLDQPVVRALFAASKVGGMFLADMNGDGIIDNGDRIYLLDDGTVGGAGTGGLYMSVFDSARWGGASAVAGQASGWSPMVRIAEGVIDDQPTPQNTAQLRGLAGTVLANGTVQLYATEFDNVPGNNSYIFGWNDGTGGVQRVQSASISGTTATITLSDPLPAAIRGTTTWLSVNSVGTGTGTFPTAGGYNGVWNATVSSDGLSFTYTNNNSGLGNLSGSAIGNGTVGQWLNTGSVGGLLDPQPTPAASQIVETLADGTLSANPAKAQRALRGVAFAPVAATTLSNLAVDGLTSETVAPNTTVTFSVHAANPQAGVTLTGLKITFVDVTTNTVLGQGTIDGSGNASLSVSVVGQHIVKAYFAGGGAQALASVSTGSTVTVNASGATASTTSLAVTIGGSTATQAAIGRPVTLTATVTGVGATGTVSFYNGTTLLGSAAVSAGSAALTTSFSVAGTASITATYNGDGTFATSSSPAISLTIGNNAAAVITTSANNVAVGATPTYTATLTGPLGVVAGTVQFQIDGVNLGSAQTLNGSGAASITSTALTAGSHLITIKYTPTVTSPYNAFNVDTITSSSGVALIETAKQALTPGNLLVVQRGDGTTNLGSSGYLVFLDEYRPSGQLVQRIALPNADSGSTHSLLLSGQNGSEGLLQQSGNGQYVTISGYDVPVGQPFITSTQPYQFGRTIARIDAAGNVDTSTSISSSQWAITAASWSSGTATITAGNNLQPGDSVTIAGMTPTGFNGTFTVATASATQFTFALASNPGTATGFGTAAGPHAGVPFNPEDVVTNDGTSFWMASSTGTGDTVESGILYATLGSTTAKQIGPINHGAASIGIYGTGANAQLAVVNRGAGELGAPQGLDLVGTGLPTTGIQTLTSLPNLETEYEAAFPTGRQPEQFVFLNTNDGSSNNPNLVYIADQAYGLLKFWKANDGNWHLGQLGSNAFGEKFVFAGGATGVVATIVNPGTPAAKVNIYVTGSNVQQANPNQIAFFQDANGAPAGTAGTGVDQGFSSGNFTTLAFVGDTGNASPNGNMNFAGLALVPGFVSGNLAVTQVGSGSAALTSSATPVFVNQFTPAGLSAGSVSLPTGGDVSTITGATWSAGVATITAANDYKVGQQVTIAGVTPSLYNGTFIVKSVIGSVGSQTGFTFDLPLTAVATASRAADAVTITGVSWANVNGVGTVTVTANNTFSPGQTVIITGVTPTAFSGTFTVASATATSFTYLLGTNPGTATLSSAKATPASPVTNVADAATSQAITAASTASQSVTPTAATSAAVNATITGASWSSSGGGTVTITAANSFSVGQNVTIAGITGSIVPGGYNGTFPIVSATATSFTYVQATNPGVATFTGTAQATGYVATITTPNSFIVGQNVTIAGVTGSLIAGAYNGTFPLLTATATNFTYNVLAGNPGTATLSSPTASGLFATLTVGSVPTGLVGQTVIVAGVNAPNNGNYNGSKIVTGSTATTVTYAVVSDPGSPADLTASPTLTYNTATVTAANSFAAGNSVAVAGVTGATTFNGTVTLVSANSTSFTYYVPSNPITGTKFGTANVLGALTEGGTSAGEGYITQSQDGHTLEIAGYNQVPGSSTSANNADVGVINAAGVVDVTTQIPSQVNGVRVAVSPDGLGMWVATGTSVRYVPFANSPSQVAITGASWSPTGGGTATITAANSFTAGQIVAVTGLIPTGYNGTVTVLSASSTSFTYALVNNPGPATTIAGAFAQLLPTLITNQVSAQNQTPTVVAIGTRNDSAMGSGTPAQLVGTAGAQFQNNGTPSIDGPFYIGSGLTTSAGNSISILGTGTDPNWPSVRDVFGQFPSTNQVAISPDGNVIVVADSRVDGKGGLLAYVQTLAGSWVRASDPALGGSPLQLDNFSITAASEPVNTANITATSSTPATITAASWAAGTLTITAANTFTAGQTVILSGFTNSVYNGRFTVATATASSFTVALAQTTPATPSFGTALARAANVVATATNTFVAGQNVTITGNSNTAYNGTFAIASATPTSFTYTLTAATDPGTPGATATATVNSSALITTSSPVSFVVGQTVNISGVDLPAYNTANAVITSVAANKLSFTYNPGFSNLASSGPSVFGAQATSLDGGFRALTADWSNPSNPVLYATTSGASGNRLVKVMASISEGTGTANLSNFTILATAPTNTAFRGVALTPTNPGTTASTTTLAVSGSPGTYGSGVQLTATVTSGATGWVSFRTAAGLEIGSAPISGTTATLFTNSNLAAGSYSLVAVYTGDSTFAPSTSASQSVTINKAGTSTTLAFSPNPVATNQTVTLTATVNPNSGTPPTGTVTFTNGATTLGTAAVTQVIVNQGGFPVVTFQASMTTSFGTAGTVNLTATYNGDANYTGSNNGTAPLNVVTATTTTLTTNAANPGSNNQSLTLTATVSASPTPAGSVSFYDGSLLVGSQNLNGSGVATLNVTTSPVQSITITQASSVGTTATFTTDATLPASLVGKTVVIESIAAGAQGVSGTPTNYLGGYNGTFTIATVSGNQFTVTNNAAPGITDSIGGMAIIQGVLTPGLHSLQAIYNPGANQFGISVGVHQQAVQSVAFGANDQFEERLGDGLTALNTLPPLTFNGSAGATNFIDEFTPAGVLVQTIALPSADSQSFTISAASGNGTTVSVTTAAPNDFATGQKVTIAGLTGGTGTFNGDFVINVTDSTHFTYSASGSGTASVTGATAQGVVHAVVGHGQQSTTGQVTLSSDGAYLFLTGYDQNPNPANPGYGALQSVSASTTPRSIARIRFDGLIDTEAFTSGSTGINTGGNFNAVYSPDGSKFYVGGSNGIYYFPTFTASAAPQGNNSLISAGGNLLSSPGFTTVGLESYGGNLYVIGGGAAAGTNFRLAQVGAGLPTTNTGLTVTQLPGIPTDTTTLAQPIFFPVDAYFTHLNGAGTALDTIYVADNGKNFGQGSITKWSLVGSNWQESTVSLPYSNTIGQLGFYYLSGATSGNTVTLYTNYGNGGNADFGPGFLYSMTDASGYSNNPGIPITGASWASNVATITAANNYAVGQYVTVSNVNPAGFNGRFVITAANSTSFSYALASNPGTYVSGGSALSINTVAQVSPGPVGGPWYGNETFRGVAAAAKAVTTTTTLTLNGISPSTAGGSIEIGYNPTVTVQVNPAAGPVSNLSGLTVQVLDASNGNAVVGSGTLDATGKATITLTTGTGAGQLNTGTHNLVASFPAGATFAASQSAQVGQVIDSVFKVQTIGTTATLNESQTTTGFREVFNAPVLASGANPVTVYGNTPTTFGSGASVSFVQGSNHIHGSLVFDTDQPTGLITAMNFVETGGFATPGGPPTAGLLASNSSYSATLLGTGAGLPVLKDTNSHVLAGDGTTAGTNHTFTFTTPTGTLPSVNAPYFARGFSQTVNIPGTATTGIPLSITNPSGGSTAATSASFTFKYDPNLLNVTNFSLPSGVTGTVAINNSAGTVTASGLTGFSVAAGSTQTVLFLTATVPSTAPLKGKADLSFTGVTINGSGGVSGDAVEETSFAGDADGNLAYSTQDAFYVTQYALGAGTTGSLPFQPVLTAYPSTDPQVLLDVNAGGGVNTQSAFTVVQKALGTAAGNAALPDITANAGSQPADQDPKFYLSNVSGAPGQTITVFVYMQVNESGGIAYNSDQAVVEFDPSKISISNVRTPTDANFILGASNSGNVSTANALDTVNGELRIGQFWSAVNPPNLANGTTGELVAFDVTILSTATPGSSSPLNLVPRAEFGASTTTQYNGVESNVTPAPTNGFDAGIDGSVNVVAPSVAMYLPANTPAAAGSTFTVPLKVTGNTDIPYNSDQAVIEFDPTKLQIINVTSGDYGANNSTAFTVDTANGELRLGQFWQVANPPTISAGQVVDLADITVKVLSNATPGTTLLNIVPKGEFGASTTTQFNGLESAIVPAPTNGVDAGIDGVVNIVVVPNAPPVTTVPAAGGQVLFNPSTAVGLHTAATNSLPVPVSVKDTDANGGVETTTVFLTGSGSPNPVGTLSATPSGSATVFDGTGAVPITAATWSSTGGGTATITLGTATNYLVGEEIKVSGVTPAAYNGTWSVVAVSGTTVTFALPLTADPGAGTAFGSVVSGYAVSGSVNSNGTAADLNNTLATLVYTPGAGFYGTTTLTAFTDDNGNSNAGGPITTSISTSETVVGMFISEVNLNKVNTTNPSQYVEIFSTAPSFTIPANVYLVGVNGQTGAALARGVVQDTFLLSGLTTGANGYLALEEKGEKYTSAGVEDGNGNVLVNSGTGVGFGSGATSSKFGNAANIHTGGNRSGRSDTTNLITDVSAAPSTYLLIQNTGAAGNNPTVNSTNIDPSNNGTVGGTAYNAWNVMDSVAILDSNSASRSYAATTFRPTAGTGTTLSGSTVIPTSTWVANFAGRNGKNTGTSSADWLASVITGSASTGLFNLSATQSTAFAGQPLNNVGGPNSWAPTATVLVNDGTSTQHSQVSQLTVNFSQPVNISDVSAFSVKDAQNNPLTVNVVINGSVVPPGTGATGVTQAIINFNNDSSADTFAFAAADPLGNTRGLKDGNYFLNTDGTKVSANGILLDWQHNGQPGAGGTEIDEFWRLFGDINGTRAVNGLDNAQFNQANHSVSGSFGGSVGSATTNSSGLITMTMQGATLFSVGETITVTGVAIGGNATNAYNGTFTVLSVTTDGSGNTVITYQAASVPSAPADANTGGVSTPTYQWYLDSNMDGNIDVGNTTDQAAFRANLGKRLTA